MTNEIRVPQVKATLGTTDNDTFGTKGYIDAQIGGGSATHENLTISTPGQTAFTLASTPIDPAKSQLYLNGQLRIYGGGADYTISGTTLTWNDPGGLTLKTTDDFQIWYNISIGGGILDQSQIYYVAKAGDDANNGKSIERPFLTIGAAIAAVNGQTPGPGNRFEIQVIGGGTYNEDFSIPTYTTLNTISAHFTGEQVVLLAESAFYFDEYTVPNSSLGLRMISDVKAYAEGNLLNGGTSSTGIILSQGELRTNIKKIDMTGTGSIAWNLSAAAILYLSYDSLKEDGTSIKIGGAVVFENGLDSGSNADTRIYNEVGDLILKGDNVDFSGTNAKFSGGGTEIFTNVGQYPKWTFTPLLNSRTSGEIPNVTGLSAYSPVLFDDDFVNIGNHYNPATGIFAYPLTGYYLIASSIGFEYLTSAHNRFFAYIDAGAGLLRYLGMGNAAAMRRNPGVSDDIFVGSCHIVKGFNGNGAQVSVAVGGGVSNTVAIKENSSFDVYLLGAA